MARIEVGSWSAARRARESLEHEIYLEIRQAAHATATCLVSETDARRMAYERALNTMRMGSKRTGASDAGRTR